MIENQTKREQLSALVDGELQGAELAQALEYAVNDEGQLAWRTYHLVGDVLRSPELARPGSEAFLAGLRDRLAQEPSYAANTPTGQVRGASVDGSSAPVPVQVDAANESVFRWKMVAGLASLAAVVAVGWGTVSALQGASAGAQIASGGGSASPAVVATTEGEGSPVMIRDPRLDELIAAHKQYGGASALQMPAGFLRNATFESPNR